MFMRWLVFWWLILTLRWLTIQLGGRRLQQTTSDVLFMGRFVLMTLVRLLAWISFVLWWWLFSLTRLIVLSWWLISLGRFVIGLQQAVFMRWLVLGWWFISLALWRLLPLGRWLVLW